MTDVPHELDSLRFVVDSPLSSKVAMFNNQVNKHQQAQLLNPFSNSDGRVSPKPTFSKDEYGKPLAGSLTEMRGQKANMHVLKEMLELCQIIDSEGYDVKDESTMRVIQFGELFNIYNYISDKCVGILLRARKHKLVDFEGEMLFQRRDDDVPIFLLKPIQEIRRETEVKIEEIKRGSSPAPKATSVLFDKSAYRFHGADLAVPDNTISFKSRSPSIVKKASSLPCSKAASPAPYQNVVAANVEIALTDVLVGLEKTEIHEERIMSTEVPVEKQETNAGSGIIGQDKPAEEFTNGQPLSTTEVMHVFPQQNGENLETSYSPSTNAETPAPERKVNETPADSRMGDHTTMTNETMQKENCDFNNDDTENGLPTIVVDPSVVLVFNATTPTEEVNLVITQ